VNDIKRTALTAVSHGFTLWLITLNFVAVFYWLWLYFHDRLGNIPGGVGAVADYVAAFICYVDDSTLLLHKPLFLPAL